MIIRLARRAAVELACPECGRAGAGYDHQVRRWRHLDTCQYQTILEAPVRRGLARRQAMNPCVLGVDEKSFPKGHEYVAVVGDDRSKASLDAFYDSLTDAQKKDIVAVAMDMCQPRQARQRACRRRLVASTSEKLHEGESKIVFDKFHLARQLSDAVDKVRREENKRLRAHYAAACSPRRARGG